MKAEAADRMRKQRNRKGGMSKLFLDADEGNVMHTGLPACMHASATPIVIPAEEIAAGDGNCSLSFTFRHAQSIVDDPRSHTRSYVGR